MIITKEVEVKINRLNIEHYINQGFDVKLKDIIKIDPKFLTLGSNIKINIKCDICKHEKTSSYQKYLEYIKKDGIYMCKKCANIKIEQTNIEKYGVKRFNNRIKSKETIMKNFGVDNVSKIQDIKDKKINKSLEKFGCVNVFQSEEIKEKSKETLIRNYGVEHPLQNDELLKKSMNTCHKNHGVDYPSQSEELRNIRNSNNLIKFGKEHYTQTDEYKENVKLTNMKKYGFEWYMQSDDFKLKSMKTMNNEYGVDYPSQSSELYLKSQISGKRLKLHEGMNLYYRGSYEKDFLDFCHDNKICVEKGPTLSYIQKEKKKKYHSDFYFQKLNLIIEIKSKYYYDLYLESNILKKEYSIKNGYSFLFIIDKNYNEFINLLNDNIRNSLYDS